MFEIDLFFSDIKKKRINNKVGCNYTRYWASSIQISKPKTSSKNAFDEIAIASFLIPSNLFNLLFAI
jgi:hypothetical protein